MYFPTNLKYLRKKNNLSLKKLGSIIGKTDVALFHWEQGTRQPSLEDLIKLSNYFKVSIDNLLKKDIEGGNNASI